MFKPFYLVGAVAAMLPLFAFVIDVSEAANNQSLSVDARFDKTGDGIVDASDWSKMSRKEQVSYARESIIALGENPDTLLLKRKSRAQQYLEGLRSVYE
ncbi:MAG: hypothetical protein Q9M20_06415 [Mariprofundaceae bacterium]|nr:hypothetical protein [Mariprofundaceae bacterium]